MSEGSPAVAIVESMKESSYKISFRENLSLHVWENRPESPCAAVLLCHGSTWHSGYFRKLGRELASRNILVVAFDFPGHGLSDSVTPDAPRGLVLDFDKDLVEALLVVRCASFISPVPTSPSITREKKWE